MCVCKVGFLNTQDSQPENLEVLFMVVRKLEKKLYNIRILYTKKYI